MATNYRKFVAGIVPTVLRSRVGRRLVGAVALMFDDLGESLRHAIRAPWVGDSGPGAIGPAYDGLSPAGSELSLGRYAVESWSQYHTRLQRSWEDWTAAGHDTSIVGQLEAAGFPGAIIYSPQNAIFTPDGYWSHFIVFFPEGTHTVVGAGPAWGSFEWGDGTQWGPIGLPTDGALTIRRIVRKFKPGHWICRWVVFEISGWTWGTGHTWGEPGLVWGGTQARMGG